MMSWVADLRLDANAVRRRMRFVGITQRRKNSPNTWRWQQRAPWTAAFRPGSLKGVSVPERLWDYLGNLQGKVTRWNPHWRWTDAEMQNPPRDPEHAAALRLALALHEAGRTRNERATLAALLAADPAMQQRWLRSLVTELRG